jgi:hypothetical protein
LWFPTLVHMRSYMKDMGAVRYNEKVKRVSTLLGGAGLAFIITAFTRSLDRHADIYTLIWIFVGLGFILVAVQMNDLLQQEDEL